MGVSRITDIRVSLMEETADFVPGYGAHVSALVSSRHNTIVMVSLIITTCVNPEPDSRPFQYSKTSVTRLEM